MEQESIDRFRNNCTLVTVREACRKADAEILAAFRKRGYKDNYGCCTDVWLGAARDLGLQLNEIPFRTFRDRTKDRWEKRAMTWRNVNYSDDCPEDNFVSVLKRHWTTTVNKFCIDHPTGTFLIHVNAHAFVIRNGTILDPNVNRAGLTRYVRGAWEVLNAPEIAKKGTIRILVPPHKARRFHAGGKMTRAHRIYTEMVEYVRANPFVTKENIFANLEYNRTDWNWDIKRSNIMEE